MPECVDGLVCGTGLYPVPVPVNPELNGSALTATPGFTGIHVKWTLADTSIHVVSHTQLYRGVSSDFALALKHQVVKGDYYFDSLGANDTTTYYYWIKNVDVSGQEGNLIGPASCQALSPIEEILVNLTGQIDSSYLSTALNADIQRITELETSLGEEVINRTGANTLINTLLTELQNTTNNINTLLVDEINTRVTDNGVYISSLNALGGMVGDNAALIATETQLRVDADTAFASQLSVLTGRVGTAESTLASLDLVSASEVEALTTRITTAESTLGTTVSRLTTEETTRANADSALSGRVTNLETGLNGQITTAVNQATVAAVGYCEIGGVPNAFKTSKSACESAGGVWLPTGQIAVDQAQYETSANGQFATVNTSIGTHTTQLGQLMAEYVVKLTSTAANGKQLVGGFGLTNTGATVDAGFNVDTFWVGRTGSNAIKPFIIDGGVVYINTAVIKNGTIGRAQIGNGQIDTAHIGNLTVTGAQIGTLTVDTIHIKGSAITTDKVTSAAITGIYSVEGTNATNVEVTSLEASERIIIHYNWLVGDTGSQPATHDCTLWARQVNSNGTKGSWFLLTSGWVYSYTYQARVITWTNNSAWYGIEFYAASRVHQASQATTNPLLATTGCVTQLVIHRAKR